MDTNEKLKEVEDALVERLYADHGKLEVQDVASALESLKRLDNAEKVEDAVTSLIEFGGTAVQELINHVATKLGIDKDGKGDVASIINAVTEMVG